ncbi:MAG TPA: TIGR01777 family oxidoreductase [Candidatus Aminicenantes bacterium]|nr:TIGR01777 family oxidoreductase [Candidatus Aminicenantes bacterium]
MNASEQGTPGAPATWPALENRRIVLAGGSGMIGWALRGMLAAAGAIPVVLSRNPPPPGVFPRGDWRVWVPADRGGTARLLAGADAVVNLTGQGIAGGRWTPQRRQLLRQSRLVPARTLTDVLRSMPTPPGVFIQVSATGYYGPGGEAELTEDSPVGSGFLAGLVADWEEVSAPLAGVPGIRRVVTRLAPVWSNRGGAIPRLAFPFRFGLGGRLGDGNQWTSWIHLDDAARALARLLVEPRAQGIFNLAAPETVRNRDLARAIGRILHRPAWLAVPAALLRLEMGELADEMLLASQRVKSDRLRQVGFAFAYPAVEPALRSLLANGSAQAHSSMRMAP